MRITFLGAAGTVTGSKYLLDTGRHRILVDCGLFQGLKALRLKNWDPLPIDASEIDAVIFICGKRVLLTKVLYNFGVISLHFHE